MANVINGRGPMPRRKGMQFRLDNSTQKREGSGGMMEALSVEIKRKLYSVLDATW